MRCKKCNGKIEKDTFICSKCKTPFQVVPDFSEFDEVVDELLSTEEEVLEEEDALSEEDRERLLAERKRRSRRRRNHEKRKRQLKVRRRFLVVGILLFFAISILLTVNAYYQKLRRQELSVDYQLEQAEAAKAGHDYEGALTYYEKALALEPESTAIRERLALLYLDEKENEKAIAYFKEILELDPENRNAWESLISIYEADDDTDSVLALMEEVPEDLRSLFSAYIVSPPEFDKESGSYNSYLQITITAAAGQEIYYCMDGGDPSENGILYEKPISLRKEGEHYIWAVCRNAKGIYSDAVASDYYIEIPPPEAPTAIPDQGDFAYKTEIYISAPEGCNVYYTWDGSTPDKNSKKAGSRVTVPTGNNILSMIAIDKETGKSSLVQRCRYTYYPAEN